MGMELGLSPPECGLTRDENADDAAEPDIEPASRTSDSRFVFTLAHSWRLCSKGITQMMEPTGLDSNPSSAPCPLCDLRQVT